MWLFCNEMMLVNVEMKLDFTVFMKGIISNLILEVMIVNQIVNFT